MNDNMIAPEKLTRKKISKILVRKHKKFLKECQREFEVVNRIRVIKEKQELLEYWLSSSQNPKKENSYLKKLEDVDRELIELKEELNSFSDGNCFDDNYLKNRYKGLESRISEEEKAIPYWQTKIRENG